MKKFGVIFDMDGTMIDNMTYHTEAFRVFHGHHNIKMADDFLVHTSGKTNNDIMRMIFGAHITNEQVNELGHEKESLYRELYRSHLKLVKGLDVLLDELAAQNIPMCVGSSAPDDNIDFVLDGLNIRRYFKAVINSSQITHGKPHPEVFLKAADAMLLKSDSCVVVEDAILGVEAARNAGMKVIAVTTIMSPEQLQHADMTIKDFTKVSVETFENLLK